MPDYVTVFQISSGSSGFPFALLGLVPLIIGGILLVGKWLFRWRQPNWIFAIFLVGLGLMWIYLVSGPILTQGKDAFTAFQAGQYSLVEGTVRDFHPMPYEGHEEECFTVETNRFCYSDYEVTPGFHNTASHGGPMRSGIHVRIAHLGPTILRLQIRKDELITPTESAFAAESAQRQYKTKTESDPVVQRMETAFLFTIVCWILWSNLQWRRAMLLWLRPPYKQTTVYVFRIFFGLSLISSLIRLAQQLQRHPLTGQDFGSTLLTAVSMCALVAMVTAVSIAIRRN